jgi:hypothetical protein
MFMDLCIIEPTRCNCVVEFIIPMFLNCSTSFGRHTAHHEEFKNCNCSLWFYIRFWLLAAVMAQPAQWPATKNVTPEAAITVFELLMMGGVSPETCWAIKKHWNNAFYYTVASCWFFLWIELALQLTTIIYSLCRKQRDSGHLGKKSEELHDLSHRFSSLTPSCFMIDSRFCLHPVSFITFCLHPVSFITFYFRGIIFLILFRCFLLSSFPYTCHSYRLFCSIFLFGTKICSSEVIFFLFPDKGLSLYSSNRFCPIRLAVP